MYQSSLKMDGSVIGLVSNHSTGQECDASEAFESTQANEYVIFIDSDNQGNQIESVAEASICPATGDLIWLKNADKIGVEKKTVGMSQMSSMLRDSDRNSVYYQAIKTCVDSFTKTTARSPIVLDIGTGTGLLAMMAASSNARQVVGCEMFNALANISSDIIKLNQFSEHVQIIPCKSVDVELGTDDKADILVSELLDSALLGESCLFSHHDAINRLLVPTPIISDTDACDKSYPPLRDRILPYSGVVTATLVQSDYIRKSADTSTVAPAGVNPYRIDIYSGDHSEEGATGGQCRGGQRLYPIHWERIEGRSVVKSSPTDVLTVSFHNQAQKISLANDANSLDTNPETVVGGEHNEDFDVNLLQAVDTDIAVTEDGPVDGLLVWWTIRLLSPHLDPADKFTYSTKPGHQNWQDHWLQCVYPLAEPIHCRRGDLVRVSAGHDWIQIHFHVTKVQSSISASSASCSPSTSEALSGIKRRRMEGASLDDQPEEYSQQVLPIRRMTPSSAHSLSKLRESNVCTCGWHLLCGPERLQMLNDACRGAEWEAALQRFVEDIIGVVSSDSEMRDAAQSGESSGQNWARAAARVVPVVLDTADGSLLSLRLASLLKERYPRTSVRIVSRETKAFSNLFHTQLVSANDLDDYVTTWDGTESLSRVLSDWVLNVSDSDASSDPSSGAPAHEDTPLAAVEYKIVGMLSECFFYQLSSLPTWQAIKHFYTCHHYRENFHSKVVMMPKGARVMAVAVELSDLSVSHGLVDSVCGFNHKPLDEIQSNWHDHMFPYKLGHYNKRFLTEPTCIAHLDFCTEIVEGYSQRTETSIPFARAGTCHCVAIWVDLNLCDSIKSPSNGSGSISVQNCRESYFSGGVEDKHGANREDFAMHHNANLKFFKTPVSVYGEEISGNLLAGVSGRGRSRMSLHCASQFLFGASDFTFHFEIVSAGNEQCS